MTQLTIEVIQEGPERIVEVLHEGPRGPKGDPGETLVLTGPALAGRASGTGNLVPIPLAPGLGIVNGVLTLTGAGTGSVTSVGLSVPLGFTVANSPVTSSGTLAITYATGYSLPTTVRQAQWDLAYQDLGLTRTPTAHKSNHATGGSDVLTPADIGAATAAQGAKADSAVQPSGLTKAAVGLGNVDNISDLNKPISTATAAALAGKVDTGDSRLSDPRTPTAHKSSHSAGGADPLSPGDIGAATAAQGAKADTAIQPGNPALSDARTPTAHKNSHATGGSDALTAADIGAAAADHGHTIANVTGLPQALDGKAALGHGHAIADVSDLSGVLSQKADLVNGVLPTSQLPALAITSYLGAVANQAALLALTGERGDWAIRLDRNSVWILSVDAPSLLNSWVELPIPTGVVLQVNNQTGVVTLGPGDVGAEPAGTTAAALAAHLAAANPHGQYELKNALGNAAYRNIGTTAGTVAAGDDARFAALEARLNAFRDAATFYVSKRITASDSNTGTSPGEPFLTGGAAIAAAKAYVAANPEKRAKVEFGPGTYVEASLPFRTGPNILATGSSQRTTILKPASGQEFNGFFALDSGCMVMNFTFAGHQATGTSDTDSSVGTRAWAISFDQQANGGQGVYLTASPYVINCASITAEDDSGLAGSTSTGDTGGGVEIDGDKCKSDSPIRSMVVYGFTQQNLGGPGAVVKNDGYGEFVSFFGLFCTWHVQAETGGWATLSGGGCSEFGIYGIVADGYSKTPLYTGTLRVAASSGSTTVDVASLASNRIGTSSRPHNGQILLLGGSGYVVVSSIPIDSSGTVVADSAPSRAGYRVSIYNPTGIGLVANIAQGSTADFRRRSQVSAGYHTSLFVGSGTNYNALPWNGGIPVRANQFVERNFGRVFGQCVNDAGDISAASGAFAVDGTSGSVTINTSSFNISGLNKIGPFSRNGLSPVGVQLEEFSNNTTLLNSLGLVGQDTAPTQFAVKGYIDPLLAQLAPLNSPTFTGTVSGITKAMVGLGNVDNISDLNKPISTATAAALAGKADLVGGVIPSSQIPSIAISDYLGTASSQSAMLSLSGQRGDWAIRTDRSRAWILSGDNASQIGNWVELPTPVDAITSVNGQVGVVVLGPSDIGAAPSAHNQAWSTITSTPTTLSGYGITDAISSTTTRSANLFLAGPASGAAAAATFRALIAADLPANQFDAVQTLTISGSTYTIDCTAANEARLAAAIAGNVIINLSNIASIPSGYHWPCTLTFTFSSGSISWFTGNAGFTVVKQTLPTLVAGSQYKAIIGVFGGTTTIAFSVTGSYT